MKMKIGNREIIVLLATAVLTLVAGAAAILKDTTPEWEYYQNEFRAIVSEKIADADPARIPSGVQQIWVEKLNRVVCSRYLLDR